MTSIVKKIERFFADVMSELGHEGWKIIWNGDPWCNWATKTIYMDELGSEHATKHLLLHEITHADLGWGGHDIEFWDHCEELTHRFLGEPLDERNRQMKKDYLGWKRKD